MTVREELIRDASIAIISNLSRFISAKEAATHAVEYATALADILVPENPTPERITIESSILIQNYEQ